MTVDTSRYFSLTFAPNQALNYNGLCAQQIAPDNQAGVNQVGGGAVLQNCFLKGCFHGRLWLHVLNLFLL